MGAQARPRCLLGLSRSVSRFLPPPGPATLEIGCGEGRISRDLTAAGHDVTAIGISPELIDAAREAQSARHYHVADAAGLPFASNHFDCVAAYNLLMGVPDLTAVVKESSRVLAVGGHLVISIVHPFTDRMEPPTTFLVDRRGASARHHGNGVRHDLSPASIESATAMVGLMGRASHTHHGNQSPAEVAQPDSVFCK